MTSLFDDFGNHAPPPDVVTKAAFAEEIGVSKPRVSQLVKQGLPLTETGKVRRAAALQWYRTKIDPNRRKAFAEKSNGSTRTQLEVVKIERERLALAKDRSELIDRSTARNAVFERARAERDAWIGWTSRVAPQMAAELGVDPAVLFAALDRETRAQLAELATTPMEKLGDG